MFRLCCVVHTRGHHYYSEQLAGKNSQGNQIVDPFDHVNPLIAFALRPTHQEWRLPAARAIFAREGLVSSILSPQLLVDYAC